MISTIADTNSANSLVIVTAGLDRNLFFGHVEKVVIHIKNRFKHFISKSHYDKMSMDLDAPVYMQQQEQVAAT